ncbi:CPBP family intramembrane glutamic endopeptidase [Bdellovibrio bacteriovorus]|nr:CPBP family intramembrane glutamic endopeptidase [Bdellovibrio bacteriovorus]
MTLTTAVLLWRAQDTKWYGLIEFKIRPAMIAILLGLLSFGTVAAWVHFTAPSMEQIPFKVPNGTPLIEVTGMILIFAVLNSFAEEFIFRGLALNIMMPKSFWIANVMQSTGFMFLHYKGFPFGLSGALLAGAFAFIMGLLRFKTGSLTYPWLAHFVANIGMGFLLYSLL